ncbi:RNA-binding protein [Saliterribacillus persicus]|uniref:RNA-binding protein YlmH n=1 Tax=Saliterribacillus persicus TaxID=930114 RepID=A0A368XUE8_9BACI|nr:RNA-binding protein [Saliterribacillus persicus]RCW70786.1 RNA-binding protein YlmH [Saliterribacillus persicus]
MDLYQHFRREEYPFIEQVLSWKELVSERFTPKVTDFINPREQRIFQTIIGNDENLKLLFYGGWENAERKKAILAPTYEPITEEVFELELLQANYPSKFVNVEHPDVLGAFLGSGIERKKIGDIVISENHIQIAVSSDITPYLKMNVTGIKKASVNFEAISIQNKIEIEQEWEPFYKTCSSKRLDVVLKEMHALSRQKAADYINKGLVKVNYQTINNTSFLLEEEDMVSVRGFGRVRIKEVLGTTKKGKIRLTFEKLK